MLGVLEDIEQMPLRHPSPDRLLKCIETWRQALGCLTDQMRGPIRVDPQCAVIREARVDFLGQLVQFAPKLRDESGGILRQLHRSAIVVESPVAFVPGKKLRPVVVVGAGANGIQVTALQRLGQVHENAEFHGVTVEEDLAVLPLLDEGLPALRGEPEVQRDVQGLMATALMLADDLQGIEQARIRAR